MTVQLLHKDEAVPLPDQISNIIRSRIESGFYQPGKKLDTVRQFARDFSVSQVTVIKALDILEAETLIKRVPVKGVFVSHRMKLEKKQLNACFAFPEKKMAPEESSRENWGLNFELYRGLLTGAEQYGIALQFTYFKDDPSPELLKRQLDALRNFDFVIFPGYSQLQELRDHSSAERPTFYLTGKTAAKNIPAIAIDYDREDARQALRNFLVASGRKSAAAIMSSDQDGVRAGQFLADAKASGIEAASAPLILDKDDPELPEKLRSFLLRREADFILVDYPEFMLPLYEAALSTGMVPGKDFLPTAVASGLIFTGLLPQLSYFRIPRYEMGLQIMEMADKILRKGKKAGDFSVFPKVELSNGSGKVRNSHSKTELAVQ